MLPPQYDPASTPVYSLGPNGQFLVDATGGAALQPNRWQAMLGLNTADLVQAQVNTLSNLIVQVQTAQMNAALHALARKMGLEDENTGSGFTIDTNGLWLDLTNVLNGLAYLNLHHGTDYVYEVWSKQDLLASNWDIETEVLPGTNQDVMPFTVSQSARTNLFLWARDWTGITSGGNETPDWWFWKYFHTVDLSDTNLDIEGNTLLSDYQNHLDPNIISFSVLFTNQNVHSTAVPGTVVVSEGVPAYWAVLLNSYDLSNATWQPYTSSHLTVNLSQGDGTYEVFIGLRGLPADSWATWQEARLTLTTIPLTLVLTNPVGTVVSQPMIQLQGYARTPLSSLAYDLSNAVGIWTNQTGYVTGEFFDTNLMAYTTNWFQCYDLALTNGVNTIILHATDLAGRTTTASYSYTLDFSGDTNPPVLTLIWPQEGALISGSNFTLQAQVDDDTATVTAQTMDASGNTNTAQGLVERSGLVWVNNLPLSGGTNMVTIMATNAAGNASVTNFSVVENDVGLTIDPLVGDQLNQPLVKVTGTIDDSSDQVTVNGVTAQVNTDGSWEADGVPVNANGMANLDVEVYDNANNHIASQPLAQPQPITVGLAGFSSHTYTFTIGRSEPWLGAALWDDGVVNWISGLGGTISSIGAGGGEYGPSPFDEESDLPANLPNDYFGPWQYASLDTADLNNHTESKVAIMPPDQAAVGTTVLYLIRATALEFSDPSASLYGWASGDLPLPPEWLQIRGQALVNSGITNDDGSVWGTTIVAAPTGVNWDVTPVATQVYQNQAYTFNVQAYDLNLQPAVDANRDGSITFDAQDQTTADNPYRFWINNDYDGYDSSIDDYDDLDPATGSDATSIYIGCTRNLEDFTRLWINTRGITEELQNGTFLLALEWKDATDDPQLRFFQAVETNGGSLYLTDTNVAQQQIALPYGKQITEWRHLNVLTKYNPYLFQTNFWSDANVSANQPVAHLLFEGVSRGSGKLVISIYKNDGVTKLAESQPIYLDLKDVKEMYQRWTVDNNGALATTATPMSSPYPYDSTIPADDNFILFVHGWNLAPWERDAFADTAFKRLYWQGYKGHFGAFQWPTKYGFSEAIGAITDADNFDNSETNAWASAMGLLELLDSLNSVFPDHVYMFAHSMGNVVAGEALRLAGTNQVVNTYVAMQAAVPAHAYDPTTFIRTNNLNRLGIGYNSHTPNYYASYWTSGSPCYFNGTGAAGSYINFYNQQDWALSYWEVDQDFKPDVQSGYGYDATSVKFTKNYSAATELDFPENTYEIFAYCDTAFCYALGEQAFVGGPFLILGAPDQLNLDAIFSFGNTHAGHSAEFNSDNMNRADFWNTLLNKMGLLQ